MGSANACIVCKKAQYTECEITDSGEPNCICQEPLIPFDSGYALEKGCGSKKKNTKCLKISFFIGFCEVCNTKENTKCQEGECQCERDNFRPIGKSPIELGCQLGDY